MLSSSGFAGTPTGLERTPMRIHRFHDIDLNLALSVAVVHVPAEAEGFLFI